GIDLCVQLVRADYGSDAAISVARYMVVAPHRDGGQAQLLERPMPPPAESLAATCDWALERLADPLTVADLARHAAFAATDARHNVPALPFIPFLNLYIERHARP
ncbi:MAG: AraC family transcriptional regulator, partial [Trebonia sp.]